MTQKKKRQRVTRRASSPVVASLILCAATLALGVATWSFSYSLSRALETTYCDGVTMQLNAVGERFTVEHVNYNDSEGILRVWVYNYGRVDIAVDVYVRGDVEGSNRTGTAVAAGAVTPITVSLTAEAGDTVSITVMSRRQNGVYATHVIPFPAI